MFQAVYPFSIQNNNVMYCDKKLFSQQDAKNYV